MLDSWLSNLSKTRRINKQAVAIVVDSLLVVGSLWAAYSLRHGMVFSDFRSTWHLFLLLPVATVAVFAMFGIYRWVVRSSDQTLYLQLFKGVFVASVILIIITFLLPPEGASARSIIVIFGMLLLLGTGCARFIWQSLFDLGDRGEPIAIYGAGDAGRQLHQALANGSEYRAVLFIDDNSSVAGNTIGGVPTIKGNSSQLVDTLNNLEIERVIMAMPSLDRHRYQSKVERIQRLGVTVQTIPTAVELVSGKANLGEVRDISIADILGRIEVLPNVELMGKCVKGIVVLVTGGGGSIGSELCRQILEHEPKQLIIADHSEENLYKITEELTAKIASEKLPVDFVPYLCSITDKQMVKSLFSNYKIDTVFHAAAYKHVPIIESYPEQGVKVNVFGTLTVLDAAISAQVKHFTLISTDKAVRPTNSMGATKRIAELILQAKAQIPGISTRISMVRFGNVLGSSGSVVPKFKSQIEQNGPITITDPNITRYFMTIPEAAQLVMQSSAIAKGGDVFVLDMGEPVRIEDLAIAMVRMSGKRLKRETGNSDDIEIVFDGLRPGEKMYEELFLSATFHKTKLSKVFVASEDWIAWDELSGYLDEIGACFKPSSRELLRSLLLKLAFIIQDEPIEDKETTVVLDDRSAGVH